MTPPDEEIRALLTDVVLRVTELPDRSSPEDWPEAMLVTGDELRAIVGDEICPLAEEVLRLRAENAKLRALLVDLDMWGINHKALCAGIDETPCDCGADDLQLRINEVDDVTDDEKRKWFDKGQLAMQARIVKGLERWWQAAKPVAGRYWNEPHAAVCKVREIDHTTTDGRPRGPERGAVTP